MKWKANSSNHKQHKSGACVWAEYVCVCELYVCVSIKSLAGQAKA